MLGSLAVTYLNVMTLEKDRPCVLCRCTSCLYTPIGVEPVARPSTHGFPVWGCVDGCPSGGAGPFPRWLLITLPVYCCYCLCNCFCNVFACFFGRIVHIHDNHRDLQLFVDQRDLYNAVVSCNLGLLPVLNSVYYTTNNDTRIYKKNNCGCEYHETPPSQPPLTPIHHSTAPKLLLHCLPHPHLPTPQLSPPCQSPWAFSVCPNAHLLVLAMATHVCYTWCVGGGWKGVDRFHYRKLPYVFGQTPAHTYIYTYTHKQTQKTKQKHTHKSTKDKTKAHTVCTQSDSQRALPHPHPPTVSLWGLVAHWMMQSVVCHSEMQGELLHECQIYCTDVCLAVGEVCW